LPDVFTKFSGIRQMAAKVGVPASTVNSWHAKGKIPQWRHADILAAAKASGIDLRADELVGLAPGEKRPKHAKHQVSETRDAA
jgi:hypothetical protein